jgi:hypothetical protein
MDNLKVSDFFAKRCRFYCGKRGIAFGDPLKRRLKQKVL